MDISVIIPVFNGEGYIEEALRSVLEQTHPPQEIIVVDNGSTDRTTDIVERYPVKLLYEKKSGASLARITGREAATGDAFMFLDADDILGPTVLEELVAVLRKHPNAVALCPWKRYELIDGKWQVRPASSRAREGGEHPLAAWLTGWWHPPCSVLWSREAYERSGGWDPSWCVNDDGDLAMRALVQDVPMIRTSGGTSYYRRLPEGEISLSGHRHSHRGLASKITVIERIEKALEDKGKVHRFSIPLREVFEILAEEALEYPELAQRAKKGVIRNRPTVAHRAVHFVRRVIWKLGLKKDRPECSGVAADPV
ncbi:glycosyltransferase family 2 protein [Altererythrobacter sp. SALINAS58]|uniref:glycosyltransferase family 2 protein n=1 Tax=Alteripontixanthobacter muriae TaxID=2705546 RepID=UPI001576C43C|nr:glycosyltransferase family 2 protein [Alteripontixanthobacter muriae]NTZ43965.1 glycosyltransferase family 2 protein [Alteripontixanthobacter muriae]